MPIVLAVVFIGWSLLGLWSVEHRLHQDDLYALFAHTDSAGTGKTFWKEGGERHAFLYITLPFYCGLATILAALVVGSIGIRRGVGWTSLVGYWFAGLFCLAAFAAVMAWLWINAIGVFI